MRHTVRRSPRGVERTAADGPVTRRAPARTGRRAAADGAARPRCARTTTRIPPKVPERTSDSGR
ncbi:hypothetical protein F3L20_29525 [Streptomyces tendae]|uniref:Uncharacterized protein n=1 Tax=Streptomyces tendae TaxID=1932 RepID=A0ABX5ZXV7_STRTE|nr:hypothetical protein F3L20_29525 [Streptomyces tendae]